MIANYAVFVNEGDSIVTFLVKLFNIWVNILLLNFI